MRAGEYGVQLTLDADFDLTGMTAGKLHVRAPSGVETSKTLTPVGSGETIVYTTVATDFPDPGRYVLSLQVDFGASKRLRSLPVALPVDETVEGA